MVPTNIKWQHHPQPLFLRKKEEAERQQNGMLIERAHLPQDRMGDKRKMAPSRHHAVKLAKLHV